MAADDELSMTLPLLADENKHQNQGQGCKLEDAESNSHHHPTPTNNTSFFKTCFNGLNALSGFYSYFPAVFFFLINIFAVLNVDCEFDIVNNYPPRLFNVNFQICCDLSHFIYPCPAKLICSYMEQKWV